MSGTVRSIVTSITAEPTLDAVSVATARRARLPSGSTGHEASNGAVESVPRETQLPPAQAAEASEQLKNSTLGDVGVGARRRTVYGSASDAFTKPDGWVIETGGAPVSTVQVCEAGVPSVFPAGSVARASNVWLPSTRGPTVAGLAHGSQSMPPSRRHSKDEPGSLESNSNDGRRVVGGAAGDGRERRVRGGRVHRPGVRGGRRVGVAGAVDRPYLEGVAAVGERADRRRARAGSRRRASTRTRRCARLVGSNSKVGASSFTGRPGRARSSSGGRRCRPSRCARPGVGSVLPAASVARTLKVWLPSARGPTDSGLVHAVQAPASRRHSKVEPGSFEEKAKDGDVSELGSDGAESMVVCGPSRSTLTTLADV